MYLTRSSVTGSNVTGSNVTRSNVPFFNTYPRVNIIGFALLALLVC